VRLQPIEGGKGYYVTLTNKELKNCTGNLQNIRLAEELNLRQIINKERGRKPGPYSVILPQVQFTDAVPVPWGKLMTGGGKVVPQQSTQQPPKNDTPNTPAPVAAPLWSCTLYKNDGAKKDGFTGRNANIDIARADAARGCMRTNNPNCNYWSNHPEHTTCTLMNANNNNAKLPATEWTCTLYKNDGAKRDGFSGVADNELEARRRSSTGCKRTNNPSCDIWSMDPDHTTCTVRLVD
jgi:hypothetical protein